MTKTADLFQRLEAATNAVEAKINAEVAAKRAYWQARFAFNARVRASCFAANVDVTDSKAVGDWQEAQAAIDPEFLAAWQNVDRLRYEVEIAHLLEQLAEQRRIDVVLAIEADTARAGRRMPGEAA